jgi:hypothetical protein
MQKHGRIKISLLIPTFWNIIWVENNFHSIFCQKCRLRSVQVMPIKTHCLKTQIVVIVVSETRCENGYRNNETLRPYTSFYVPKNKAWKFWSPFWIERRVLVRVVGSEYLNWITLQCSAKFCNSWYVILRYKYRQKFWRAYKVSAFHIIS